MVKSILIGATGLIGKALLNQLISGNLSKEIETWIRKPSGFADPRFTEMVLAFDEIQNIPQAKADHLFCCLGTTIRKAKTKEAFRKVDETYVVNLAKLAERSRINCFLVVSSIGANPMARNLYLHTKGEMEQQVKACSIPSIYILRPSMLLGDREEKRFMEDIGKIISKLVNPFLFGSLRKYRAIYAETVATAMINCARESNPGVHVLESDEIQRVGEQINW